MFPRSHLGRLAIHLVANSWPSAPCPRKSWPICPSSTASSSPAPCDVGGANQTRLTRLTCPAGQRSAQLSAHVLWCNALRLLSVLTACRASQGDFPRSQPNLFVAWTRCLATGSTRFLAAVFCFSCRRRSFVLYCGLLLCTGTAGSFFDCGPEEMSGNC